MTSSTEAKFVAGSFSLTINSIELNIYPFAKKKKKKKKKKNSAFIVIARYYLILLLPLKQCGHEETAPGPYEIKQIS